MRVLASLSRCAKSVRRSIAARFAGRRYPHGPVSGPGAGADEGRTDEWRSDHDLACRRGGDPASVSRRELADRHDRPSAARPHGTVRRVLWQSGVPAVRECARSSKLDAYVPFIQETFARYPTLRASRLYQMVRERGYLGNPITSGTWSPDGGRGRRPEAYLRLRTLPAEQAQTIGRTSASSPSAARSGR